MHDSKNVKPVTSKANLRRLKELTDILSNQDFPAGNGVIEKIDKLISDAKKTIDKINCNDTKIKCYENLFSTVSSIVNKSNES